MKQDDDKTQVGRLLIAAKAKYPNITSYADLARHMDIEHQKITNWKRRGLPSKDLDHLCDEFDCNLKWLRHGKGEMSKDANLYLTGDPKRDALIEIIRQVPKEYLGQIERNLLAAYEPNKKEGNGGN